MFGQTGAIAIISNIIFSISGPWAKTKMQIIHTMLSFKLDHSGTSYRISQGTY
jgi:hypothetical protein